MEIKHLFFLAFVFLGYYLGKKALQKAIARVGNERSIPANRIAYIEAVLLFCWSTLALILAIFSLNIGFADLGLFFGSMIAVLGVAFFAHWSILSNVTASIIIFFFFPFKVGDQVKIIDGDNSVEGQVKEITLFHIILCDKSQKLITYPNALIFQKAVSIDPPMTSEDNHSSE